MWFFNLTQTQHLNAVFLIFIFYPQKKKSWRIVDEHEFKSVTVTVQHINDIDSLDGLS